MSDYEEIQIQIKIKVPKGATVEVNAQGSGEPAGVLEQSAGLPSDIEQRIEDETPLRYRRFISAFSEACHELGLNISLPDGKRRDYINVYPGQTALHGGRRVASVNIRSGLANLQCDPSNAQAHANKFTHAEVVFDNEVPVAAKVYLRSDEAVDDANALCRLVLEEREREQEAL